jgi:hypothetical protein
MGYHSMGINERVTQLDLMGWISDWGLGLVVQNDPLAFEGARTRVNQNEFLINYEMLFRSAYVSLQS